jgi:hypothetical protein
MDSSSTSVGVFSSSCSCPCDGWKALAAVEFIFGLIIIGIPCLLRSKWFQKKCPKMSRLAFSRAMAERETDGFSLTDANSSHVDSNSQIGYNPVGILHTTPPPSENPNKHNGETR